MTTRNETIRIIKSALQRRSGKPWSVTGGRGTAYGWITIDAPPKRRTAHVILKEGALTDYPSDYMVVETGQPGGTMTLKDRLELATLLGLSGAVHDQGEKIMSSNDAYQEYIDRAEGRTPTKIAEPYWD
jgi:hypothetical protein